MSATHDHGADPLAPPPGSDTALLRELMSWLAKPDGIVALVEDTPETDFAALPLPVRDALFDAYHVHAMISDALHRRAHLRAVK